MLGRAVNRILRRPTSKHREQAQHGYILLAAVMALFIVSLYVQGFSSILTGQTQRVEDKVVAERMADIARGVRDYVKANHERINNEIGGGSPGAFIPVVNGTGTGGLPSVREAGFLPAGFRPTNAFGQEETVLIRKPSPNRVDVLIASHGGFQIPDNRLPRIAARIGHMGGIISDAGSYNPACIYGAYGGWRSKVNNGCNGPALTWQPVANLAGVNLNQGHVVVSVGFTDGQILEDYLYRVAVPGHPDANAMTTDMHMCPEDPNTGLCRDTDGDGNTRDDANHITNVGELTFASLRDPATGNPQRASEGVYHVEMVRANSSGGGPDFPRVDKPECPTYDLPSYGSPQDGVPQIYTSVASATHEEGRPIRHFNVRVRDGENFGGIPDDQWEVRLAVTASDGNGYDTTEVRDVPHSIMVAVKCEAP